MSGAVLGRMKRAVRAAVALCGGVDGAGATAGRCRSVAGDWNNLNSAVFPPLDCALALDEVALAQGKLPPVLSAYAAELGCALVVLPSGARAEGSLARQVMACVSELGEVSARVNEALADGEVSAREAGTIEREVDDVVDAAVTLRALLRVMQAPDGQAADGKAAT